MSETYVLDASALLCLVLNEPGVAVVERAIPDGVISSVNLSEVAARLGDHGMPLAAIEAMIASFGLRVEAFSTQLAFKAAMLRPLTRSAGLSLGDRACLATAQQLGGTALTADRAWAAIGETTEIKIELVR